MSDVQVLVVGAGAIGTAHAASLVQGGDELVAIVDPAEDRSSKLAREYDAESYTSIGDALDAHPGVDVAIVASPTAFHLAQAVELVERHIAVLVEKPHRLPGEDISLLRAALRDAGTFLQIGMHSRWWHATLRLREAVASGELGRPLWVFDRTWYRLGSGTIADWYFQVGVSGGGVLLTNGIHSLDRAQWVLGSHLNVKSATLTPLIDGHATEDFATVQLVSEGGTDVTISLLWADHDMPGPDHDGVHFQVVGTKGVAEIRSDRSWSISTGGGVKSGTAPHDAVGPLDEQWAAFKRNMAGNGGSPTLDDLEPSLELIEDIYGGRA